MKENEEQRAPQVAGLTNQTPIKERKFVGFCSPNGGLVATQVIVETTRGWDGVGGHLSTNQSYAEYDAERIVQEHASKGDIYEWVGLFDNQDEMDHFQQWHPPVVTACPVRSNMTGAECLLPAGHPQDSARRFHRYALQPHRDPPSCPSCGRIMSFREKDEQGACNDCHGGAYAP